MTDTQKALMCKRVKNPPSPPAYGLHWSLAARTILELNQEGVKSGPISAAYDEVEDATLWHARTLLGAVTPILELKIDGARYQFGLNPWAKLQEHYAGPLKVESVRMRGVWGAITWRLIVLGIACYLAYQIFL